MRSISYTEENNGPAARVVVSFLGASDKKKLVALTRCGHLSCSECLNHWIESRGGANQNIMCVECRKPVLPNQIVRVDPSRSADEDRLQKRQDEAKSLIVKAAEMLDKNNGQLEPKLWEALVSSTCRACLAVCLRF